MEINPFSDVCLSIQGELIDYGHLWFKVRKGYWSLVWKIDGNEYTELVPDHYLA